MFGGETALLVAVCVSSSYLCLSTCASVLSRADVIDFKVSFHVEITVVTLGLMDVQGLCTHMGHVSCLQLTHLSSHSGQEKAWPGQLYSASGVGRSLPRRLRPRALLLATCR